MIKVFTDTQDRLYGNNMREMSPRIFAKYTNGSNIKTYQVIYFNLTSFECRIEEEDGTIKWHR